MIVWFALLFAMGDKPNEFVARGERIAKIVHDHFFDVVKANAWTATERAFALEVRDEQAFRLSAKRALAKLGTSHTGYFSDDDIEFYALRNIFATTLNLPALEMDGIGIDVAMGGFVRTVFSGSPAQASGIRRGDRIVSVDGKPFHPVRSFVGRAGMTVQVAIQRGRRSARNEVAVRVRRLKPKDEWLQAQKRGSRIFERGKVKIAYVPMFACVGAEFQSALQDALGEELKEGDALVLDFRNGWGGCNPNLVNIFDRTPPQLLSIGRDGRRSMMDSQWRKPLVLLINGGSRSGKEAVAYAIQKHKLGKLVGEKTAGAVVAGRCFAIDSSAVLYLAVADVLVDGQRLEGKGVFPDIAIADNLPFANGQDPQLDAALKAAVDSASGK